MVQHRGPRGVPVMGALPMIARDTLGFFERMARDYGDVVPFWVGPRRTWFINQPDRIEEVLVRNKDKLEKDIVTHELSSVLGEGLLTSEGETWKRHRRLIAPSFTPRHIAAYGDAMVRSTLEALPPPQVARDVHDDFTRITLHIVLRTLFGMEPDGQAGKVGRILDGLMASFEVENRTAWRLVPEWVPGRHRREVDRLRGELDAIVYGLIAAARRDADAERNDLMSQLILARDEEGHAMSDEQLRDEVLTLFLAGHETTALGLSYATWLLAEHPEHQARLRQELDTVAQGGALTSKMLRQLPFLDAVVKESLRLYPPAWAMGRQVVEPFLIDGDELAVGDQIVVSPWVLHRDARWWTGPERFRPDRWLNGETDCLPRFAYAPFGAGPRVCVGQHFAQLELTLVLGTFLQHRTVVAARGYRPELFPAVTLRARNGVHVDVHDVAPRLASRSSRADTP